MSVMSRKESKKLYQKIIDNVSFFDNLTEEEQDVITYLADGMTFKEIALGDGCTKNHVLHVRNQVFRHLGLKINRGTKFPTIIKYVKGL